MATIDRMLNPKAVAAIGASDSEGSVGQALMKNLLLGKDRRIEIGVSRLILESNKKRGEFAVVIADKYQGKGLGIKLVDMLIEVAREKGVESIYGIIMSENLKITSLCEKLGFSTRREQDNVVVELKLK